MNIRQCKECGTLFQYLGKPICADCLDELDRKFLKVREYLYKHPEASIKEVSEKTEVGEKYILDFLKEERLSLKNASGFLQCELCKKPITAGRFCADCQGSLNKAFAPPEPEKPEPIVNPTKRGARMHITRNEQRDR